MKFMGKRNWSESRYATIFGIVLGVAALIAFSSPWFDLTSAPYRDQNLSIRDVSNITGWELLNGESKLTREIVGTGEVVETHKLMFEGKISPLLALIGIFTLIVGGAISLIFNGRYNYLILGLGGLSILTGGIWSILRNPWITRRFITVNSYSIAPDFRIGLAVTLFIGAATTISSILAKDLE